MLREQCPTIVLQSQHECCQGQKAPVETPAFFTCLARPPSLGNCRQGPPDTDLHSVQAASWLSFCCTHPKPPKPMDCLSTRTISKLKRTVAGQCACGEQAGIHKGAGSMQRAASASVLLHGMTAPVFRPPGYSGEIIRLHLSF